METAAIAILKHQIEDATVPATLKAELKVHLVQTFRHARDLESLRHVLDQPSPLPPFPPLAEAVIATGSLAPDRAENALAQSYALENAEIGLYLALLAIAREEGDHKTILVCETILQEERNMAVRIERCFTQLLAPGFSERIPPPRLAIEVVEDIDVPPESDVDSRPAG